MYGVSEHQLPFAPQQVMMMMMMMMRAVIAPVNSHP